MRRAIWAVALWLSATGPGLAQPSFDCTRAATNVEHAICGSEALSVLDRDLAAAYGAVRAAVSEPMRARIQAEQLSWLGWRNSCGGDTACLALLHKSGEGFIS